MGVVYQARQLALNRLVALKVILAGAYAGAEELARFKTEAEAVARLQHPNIVQIHEVGEHAGRPYFALEYAGGGSLAAQLAGTPLPARQSAQLLETLARAVQAAHDRGVVHRDLKPGNILLQMQNAECRMQNEKPDSAICNLQSAFCIPKVTDFGLAKLLDREPEAGAIATQTGAVLGTPSYMAPEQAWGKSKIRSIGPAVDVYALGALLYEALTGRPPFRAATPLATLDQVCSQEPVPPGRLQPGLPRDLETICLKCLQKEPARRYGSALALAEDLRRFLANESIAARPTPALERAVKWARRRPVAATVLASAGLALLCLVGVSWVFTAQLSNSLEAKEKALEDKQDALKAERQAKQTAQRRAKQLKKSNDVLDSIFSDLNWRAEPIGGPSLRVQLTERLRKAAGHLDALVVDDPLTMARLQDTLGSTLTALGHPRLALPLVKHAYATRRAKLGPDDALTLVSLFNLAEAYREAGSFNKAVALHQQALARWKAKVGPEVPDTLKSMNSLAIAYQEAGQLDKALPLYEQALAKQKVKLGPDNPDTLSTMNNLALAYQEAGRLNEALPLLKEVLAKQKARLGPGHSATLNAMSNLANVYLETGRFADAFPLYEQVLENQKAQLGMDNPDTLNTMNSLASAYQYAGKLPQALLLYQQVLEKRKAKLGPNHRDTLATMSNLAMALKDSGRLERAVNLFEMALAKLKAIVGPDHLATLATMDGLAGAYQEAGQIDKAVPLYEQALAKLTDKFGPNHPRTLACLSNLAGAYQDGEQLNKAIPLFERALEKQKARLGPNHPLTLLTMANLAEAYEDVGQLKKAEFLWRDVLARQRAKDGPKSLSTTRALLGLGQTLLSLRDFAAAESVLRECLAIQAHQSSDSWVHFATRSLLGGALLGRKAFSEAEPMLVEGFEGLQKRKGQLHPRQQKRLAKALGRLVSLYLAWGQPERADFWRHKLADAKGTPRKRKP
jgi:serine/threonine protein kinase